MRKYIVFFCAIPALLALFTPAISAKGQPRRERMAGAEFKKANSAQRPYMGWSSWSFLRGKPNAAKIKAQARIMAARLLPYGYRYINIDAGWVGGFDRYGRPAANLKRFPEGMAGMAAWLHAHGLKLGIYLVPGISPAEYHTNCQIWHSPYVAREITYPSGSGNTLGRGFRKIDYRKPGAAAYIQSCANLFSRWGVDFIKMDFVGPGGGYKGFRRTDNRDDIVHWARALRNTGRPIWLELSNSLSLRYATFWRRYANGWRIDNDVEAYGSPYLTDWKNIRQRFTDAPKWSKYAGPGGWNDLDSLEIGNGRSDGLTRAERQTVMTLWCINCAPLYLGSDLRHLTRYDYKIITNRAAIAIDQAGRVATPLSQSTPHQIWRVQNANGTYTVALFNLGRTPARVTVRWRELGFQAAAKVVDIWQHKAVRNAKQQFSAVLNSHASRLLNVVPEH